MLRLFNQLGARLSRPQALTRCFSTEAQKSLVEMDIEKKRKIIELEISIQQQEGRKAPDLEKIKPDEWEHILQLPSKSSRRRYYQFLWQCEMRAISSKDKKERKKIETAERLEKKREEAEKNDHITYGLHRNTMFLRIYDTAINRLLNRKLFRAMMFEQKLILDCSYDEYMNPIEARNAGKQLMLCFAENRLHEEPFDLHFCNFNRDSISSQVLQKFIPTMHDGDFPMNVHSESLTEKFDKNKLVYLTPHCKEELEVFNHDDIYIIGAMVDKTNNEPLSLAKAKKQGIRMAKLPLDRYLNWNKSTKSLTLNQMVSIMLEVKAHGDWQKALRFVPRRKIVDPTLERPQEPQRFSYDRSMSYQQRQNGHRATSTREYREPRYNQAESYQQRQRYQHHQPSSEEFSSGGRQNYYDKEDSRRSYDARRSDDDRQDARRSDDDRQDSRRSYDDRQDARRSYDDRQDSRRSYDDRQDARRSYDDRQDSRRSYDDRQDARRSYDDRQDSRRSYDDRKDARRFFNDRQDARRPFDEPRAIKERKHFNKFKFDLDSWGSKVKSDKDPRDN